jgi:hypothetical protein
MQEIITEQAKVVVRIIFEMYAAGSSYTTIAKTFNAEGIPSPQIPTWVPGTISFAPNCVYTSGA